MSREKDPLYDFVRDLVARQKVREPLTESTELVQSQILDSMNLVRLILVIQEKWGLKVDFSSLDKENFKDLGTIRRTVERLKRERD